MDAAGPRVAHVRRDPARPKAAHIPDSDFLESVEDHRQGRAAHPLDYWKNAGFPGKVIVEKARKLTSRGLITRDYHVTPAGLAHLNGAS